MRRYLAALLSVSILGACAKKQEPVTPATSVTDYSYARFDEVAVKHMDLDLTVDFDNHKISGTASFDLDNKTGAEVVHFDTWALRILDVTRDGKKASWALGDSVADAQRRAYAAVERIHWDGEFHRTDIGWRAIARERQAP